MSDLTKKGADGALFRCREDDGRGDQLPPSAVFSAAIRFEAL